MCVFHLPQIMRQRKTKETTQKERKENMQFTANKIEEINNNNVKGEVVEEEVVVLPGKTKMLHARISCSSPMCEELRKQMVECATMSGVLHEYHPITEEVTNPWAKLCALLHDPKSWVLRNCMTPTGNKKHCCAKVKIFNHFFQ